ncbi:hypothetical protein BOTCAL_0298g00110 [Botryotinia calthae]|uniref:Uncharacterized protein n=1 Tax=Botryotinia calthae TaxID=38488 RepID=A0A4Y8CUL0_9HELO|nr:hypothetical protein BOTCAL_0298g00110 [Botryotinia calthae]
MARQWKQDGNEEKGREKKNREKTEKKQRKNREEIEKKAGEAREQEKQENKKAVTYPRPLRVACSSIEKVVYLGADPGDQCDRLGMSYLQMIG